MAPPAPPLAVFPVTVEPVRVRLPWPVAMPPPVLPALLPLTVDPISVGNVALDPDDGNGAGIAAFGSTTRRPSVLAPWLPEDSDHPN